LLTRHGSNLAHLGGVHPTMSPPAPTRLPFGLQGVLERSVADYLAAPGAPAPDFTEPAGEAALAAPDSVCWQVFRNPVSLYVGGVAAVILELAEPRVAAGSGTTPASAPIRSAASGARASPQWSPSMRRGAWPSG
jgi:hypothetical protein